MNPTPVLKIVLADELALVRAGVRLLLESATDPKVQVLAETGDGQAALELVSRLRPDLVLMDIQLGGGMDGIDAAAAIRAETVQVFTPQALAEGFIAIAVANMANASPAINAPGTVIRVISKVFFVAFQNKGSCTTSM